MNNDFLDISSNNFVMLSIKKREDYTDQRLYKKVLLDLNLKLSNVVKLKQIHSNNILFTKKSGLYPNYDGIISHIKHNIIATIATADCIPLFIYDINSGFYGLIHCGWRGIVAKIHVKAIEKFISLGSHSSHLSIKFGPAIRECCYEVSDNIINHFNSESVVLKDNKFFLNLVFQIKRDISAMGIKDNNIQDSNICTFHNYDYHSYRRDGKSSGRIYSMITSK